MTDLVEFLRARLDEDAADAVAMLNLTGVSSKADLPRWFQAVAEEDGTECVYVVAPFGNAVRIAACDSDAATAHIARHDPARVLADVEAKRRIIAWASDPKMNPELIPEAERYYILTALALPYADHPDYCEEWRP